MYIYDSTSPSCVDKNIPKAEKLDRGNFVFISHLFLAIYCVISDNLYNQTLSSFTCL